MIKIIDDIYKINKKYYISTLKHIYKELKDKLVEYLESKKIQTITSIYKKVYISYPYLSVIVKEMANTGLITREKKGRKYNISLTEKGSKVAESLKFIENAFKGVE